MKHRTIKLAAVSVIGVLMLIFSSVNLWAAEEAKPSASADIGVFSKYVWRGYELSKDSAVIQPSLTVGYKDFSFNLWGNLDTDVYSDPQGQSQFNETDMTLSYARVLESSIWVSDTFITVWTVSTIPRRFTSASALIHCCRQR